MSVKPVTMWGALWRSENLLDGPVRHLMFAEPWIAPALFRTREQARDWIRRHYGYLRGRPDLRREPHGWRMPKPVKVTIAVAEEAAK